MIAAESIEPEHPTHDWFVARYDKVRAGWERELAADQGSGMLDADVDVAVLSRLLVAVFDGAEFQFLLAGGQGRHRDAAAPPARRLLRRAQLSDVELQRRRDAAAAGEQVLQLEAVERGDDHPRRRHRVDVGPQETAPLVVRDPVGEQLPDAVVAHPEPLVRRVHDSRLSADSTTKKRMNDGSVSW